MVHRPGSSPPSTALGLVTDLYELRMAASYLKRAMVAPATFSLFIRRLPAARSFLVAAGLDDALRALERFTFGGSQLDWLASQGFDRASLDALAELSFTGDVWAVPEGRIVFPDEPLLEVTAPLPEAQLVETVLLNQLTYQTALATKATRCRLATGDRAELVDFSFRRTHGIEAGLAAARASAIAGFVGTSNVEAARRFGLPAVGTMAHSYVEAFPDEAQAFRAFMADFPDHATMLVDTYDTPTGVRLAAELATEAAAETGATIRLGVRLDSGDLGSLARHARRALDEAGHRDAMIVASGGLDEYELQRLLDEGAPIDVFGVGTKMGVSADAPLLDSAYKLVEYEGRPVMKLSPGKRTRPGPKQVYRTTLAAGDLLATRGEPPPTGAAALLEPVMIGGRRTSDGGESEAELVAAAQRRLDADLAALPPELKRLDAEPPAPVRVSHRLALLTDQVERRALGHDRP